MAVARGNAVVVTTDGKRLAGDTLVAYTDDSPKPADPAVKTVAAKPSPAGSEPGAGTDPLGASGKLKKVEAFGHVSVRTATEIVTGDRAVYVPETGIARLGGDVRITRGQNQLNGSEAEVNMKTGVSRLISTPGARVQGLVLPNDPSNKAGAPDAAKGAPGR
jgi:lipopolysaccharide export system protein LptA